MIFPDHFSDDADRYEAYRTTYPDALFGYLASLTPSTTSPGIPPPATGRRPLG